MVSIIICCLFVVIFSPWRDSKWICFKWNSYFLTLSIILFPAHTEKKKTKQCWDWGGPKHLSINNVIYKPENLKVKKRDPLCLVSPSNRPPRLRNWIRLVHVVPLQSLHPTTSRPSLVMPSFHQYLRLWYSLGVFLEKLLEIIFLLEAQRNLWLFPVSSKKGARGHQTILPNCRFKINEIFIYTTLSHLNQLITLDVTSLNMEFKSI